MITVKTDLHSFISISGHAGYAPHGRDIVCAAVSALSQTLDLALEKHSDPKERELLISAFLAGLEQIAKQYPENLEIDRF